MPPHPASEESDQQNVVASSTSVRVSLAQPLLISGEAAEENNHSHN
jgi:hypothetical protein